MQLQTENPEAVVFPELLQQKNRKAGGLGEIAVSA
jgi:hypothetical protein